jgi:pimeloyl-ACP methyl ester carboxylesterase
MMRDIILLHGALGSKSHWDHILPYLDKGFRIHNLNFPLHGGDAADHTHLELADLTGFVKYYIHKHNIPKFAIVGYSMGGYAGLDLAIRHMPGMAQLITLGTKLNWNELIAEQEIAKLDLESLTPIHEKLGREHGEQWKDVISATHSIMRSIGKDPIRKEQMQEIQIPVHLLLGEKDKMVTAEETMAFAESSSSCSYEILPAQPHLLERVDAMLVASRINSILMDPAGSKTI